MLNERTPEYEAFTAKARVTLDRLVAQNIENLLQTRGRDPEYSKIWKEIRGELIGEFEVPVDETKNPHHIFITRLVELYKREEYPVNLSDGRTSRFVKKYGILPKYAPDEWEDFEREKVESAIADREAADARIDEYLRESLAAHPEYVFR